MKIKRYIFGDPGPPVEACPDTSINRKCAENIYIQKCANEMLKSHPDCILLELRTVTIRPHGIDSQNYSLHRLDKLSGYHQVFKKLYTLPPSSDDDVESSVLGKKNIPIVEHSCRNNENFEPPVLPFITDLVLFVLNNEENSLFSI